MDHQFVFRLDNSLFVFADPYDALISFIWLVAPMNVVPLSLIISSTVDQRLPEKLPVNRSRGRTNEYCNVSLHCQAMTSRFRYHHYWTGIADTTTTKPACRLDSDFWKISHQFVECLSSVSAWNMPYNGLYVRIGGHSHNCENQYLRRIKCIVNWTLPWSVNMQCNFRETLINTFQWQLN